MTGWSTIAGSTGKTLRSPEEHPPGYRRVRRAGHHPPGRVMDRLPLALRVFQDRRGAGEGRRAGPGLRDDRGRSFQGTGDPGMRFPGTKGPGSRAAGTVSPRRGPAPRAGGPGAAGLGIRGRERPEGPGAALHRRVKPGRRAGWLVFWAGNAAGGTEPVRYGRIGSVFRSPIGFRPRRMIPGRLIRGGSAPAIFDIEGRARGLGCLNPKGLFSGASRRRPGGRWRRVRRDTRRIDRCGRPCRSGPARCFSGRPSSARRRWLLRYPRTMFVIPRAPG